MRSRQDDSTLAAVACPIVAAESGSPVSGDGCNHMGYRIHFAHHGVISIHNEYDCRIESIATSRGCALSLAAVAGPIVLRFRLLSQFRRRFE